MSENNISEVKDEAIWKAAIQKFLDAKIAEGAIVPHAWFWEAFGLTRPTDATPSGEANSLNLRFLTAITGLSNHLLLKYKIHLRNEWGEGFRIIPPEEQTDVARKDIVKDANKVFRNGMRRLVNVDTAKLTDEQRRENTETVAYVAWMAGGLARAKRLSWEEDEDVVTEKRNG